MNSIFLSMVMPAYNEEGHIREVIEEHVELASRLPASVSDWEIVCLDDASSDSTPRLLVELSQKHPKLRIITHQTNAGIFVSFDHVCRAAEGSHIYQTGSDGQWPADNLLAMLAEIEAGANVVVGVRTNRREVYDLKRRIISYTFNLLVKLLFGVQTGDAGSVKLGERAVFQFPLQSRSPFAEAERILRAGRLGYRVAFIPIQFRPRSGGQASGAKFKNIWASLRDCLKLRFGGMGPIVSPPASVESQKGPKGNL